MERLLHCSAVAWVCQGMRAPRIMQFVRACKSTVDITNSVTVMMRAVELRATCVGRSMDGIRNRNNGDS